MTKRLLTMAACIAAIVFLQVMMNIDDKNEFLWITATASQFMLIILASHELINIKQ